MTALAVIPTVLLVAWCRLSYSSRLTPDQRSVEQYARTCRASDPVSGVRAKGTTR